MTHKTPGALSDPSGAPGYRVKLPTFEGPLDLLLHLVRKHELDILNIPIAFITQQYTAYMQLLERLNIDLAADYLLMAATLVHIKTRTLLPDPPPEESDPSEAEDAEDPRAELVRRLLEYQKYQGAAGELGKRPLRGRDVFGRGLTESSAAVPASLAAVGVFQLLDAFQAVLERTRKLQDHKVELEEFSISDKIDDVRRILGERGRTEFANLFNRQGSRAEMIVTFLALLEMVRLQLTTLQQSGPLEPIYIELAPNCAGPTSEPSTDLS